MFTFEFMNITIASTIHHVSNEHLYQAAGFYIWWARKDSDFRPMDYVSTEILVIEVKYGVAPKICKQFNQTCEQIGASRKNVVYGEIMNVQLAMT